MSINSKRAQVENHISLQRDMKTTAIVNNDKTAYNRYMNRKDVGMRQKKELDELRNEIEVLKSLLLNNK
tara:strand:- start:1141 stop:1347 length:207 start_codon:yes stop_codon:yes gene_type:complete